jgi:asparagine synthase (glutamine-hydrolysing)
VSFSGGRDSSAVLAVAARVARREGLELPIPITVRAPAAPGMNESSWQELVVSHLGLTEWTRIDVEDELDFLGPVSRRLLLRNGLLFPPSVSLLALLLERSRAKTVLTGVAGDSFFGGWRLALLADAFRGRARPAARHLAALGYAAAPRALRARHLRRRQSGFAWLRPEAKRAVVAGWASTESAEPLRWDQQVRWRARLRRMSVMARSIEIVGEQAGSTIVNVFLGPAFLAALARAGGAGGFGTRSVLMEALFGDLLPAEVTNRRDKASPVRIFFSRASRRFADAWDGGGVDPALVDPQALRALWLGEAPDERTALLLQSAWLLQSGGPQRQEA